MTKTQQLKSKEKYLRSALMHFTGVRLDIKDLLKKINSLESLDDKEFNREITCKEYFIKNIEKTNLELDKLISNTKILNQQLISCVCFDEADKLLEVLDTSDLIMDSFDLRDIYKTVKESVETFTENNKSKYKTFIEADKIFLEKLQKCVNTYINTIEKTLEYIYLLPEDVSEKSYN